MKNESRKKKKFRKEKNSANDQSSDENNQNQQQQFQSSLLSLSSSQQNRQQNQNLDSFVALLDESSSFMTIRLEKFLFIIILWILDNNSNVHVCNRHMKYWFIHIKNKTREFLAIDSNEKEIEIYEDMMIIISSSFDSRKIKLSNVHYMSNFIINIVSLCLLRAKEIDFDSYSMHLHWIWITKWYIIEFNEHFLLENNTAICFVIKKFKNTFVDIKIAIVIKIASRRDWHRMMIHVFFETIVHLSISIEKIKITNNQFVLKTHKCESCALSKAHRIISRLSINVETSNKLFFRVIYDLMQLFTTFNKHEQISHFVCHSIDFNMIYIHSRKSNVTNIIKKAFNVIANHFNQRIVFFRSNKERALDVEFDNLLIEKRIFWKSSASDTSK